MTKTLRNHSMLAALALSGALGALGVAQAATLPPVQTQGTVSYLSGGVGKDEARAVEAG